MGLLNELANKVCGELPEGWRIIIDLELDSGSVELTDDYGDEHSFPSNRDCIEEQVLDALAYAKKRHAQRRAI